MAGYCSGDIIHGAYDLASCMFFPSLEETEGIVVLEALASHTPLLVRDIGVYDPWLVDGVNCHKAKTNE
jgi:1,2-diacylglycerol-3-alpha-glucose alpha-1,2-glucosyltransferase